jgi:RHS repeat-associated protein
VPVAESFVYDANGNLTLAPPNSFGYDDANRLVSTGGSPAAATYTLDGDGLQVARDVSGTPATNHFKYVYDRNRSLPVVLQDQVETIFGGSTTVTHKYVWGATGLAYVAGSDGSLAVYHADGLGSVRALTDGSGVVTQVYRTDAYGVPPDTSEPSNPPDQPFRFAGEAKDYAAAGSGLVNLRARFYAPDLGRFLQRDPHAGSPADPQSLNRYSYVQNNPVNLTDPSGLAPAKSMNLTNCITFTPLFGPPIQLCFPSTGGGQGAGQTQTQLPPCPTGYGAGNPTDTGTLSRADYQYASGPEKSGGGRYACHVNTRAGNLNRHITYNQATKEFQSDLPSTPLGGNPATAALIIAIQEGYYLATTNKLPGGLPNLGGYPAYRDWYLAPPPGGNLADRLTQLVGYAP